MRQQRTAYRMDGRRVLTVMAIVLISSVLVLLLTARSAQAKREERVTYQYYTSIQVEQGDTLWSIAEDRFQNDDTANAYGDIRQYIDEIMQINGLADQNQIRAGRSLIVPYYSDVCNE